MQIGRLEMIDQAKVDYVEKTSKIQETDQKTKVDPDEKYKNTQNQINPRSNEVILDNVKFGFNPETNDFFVRIETKDGEYQYPTEDMMRLKKALREAFNSSHS